MAERIPDDQIEAIARKVSQSIDAHLDQTDDLDEKLAILKAYASAAVFAYADITSLATAADWLRRSADYVESFPLQDVGRPN